MDHAVRQYGLLVCLCLCAGFGCSRPAQEQSPKADAELAGLFEDVLEAEKARDLSRAKGAEHDWEAELAPMGPWVKLCKYVGQDPDRSMPFLLAKAQNGTGQEVAVCYGVLGRVYSGFKLTRSPNLTMDHLLPFVPLALKSVESGEPAREAARKFLMGLGPVKGYEQEMEAFYVANLSREYRGECYKQLGQFLSKSALAVLLKGIEKEQSILNYAGVLEGLQRRADPASIPYLIAEVLKGPAEKRFKPWPTSRPGDPPGLTGKMRALERLTLARYSPRKVLVHILGADAPKGGRSPEFDWAAWWRQHREEYAPKPNK